MTAISDKLQSNQSMTYHRYSITDLLIFTVAVALIVYAGRWFGYTDLEFLLAVAVAIPGCTLLLVIHRATRNQPKRTLLVASFWTLLVIGLLVAWWFKLFAMAIGLVLTTIVSFFVRRPNGNFRLLGWSSAAVLIGLFIQISLPYQPTDQELIYVKRDFPIESLSSRLMAVHQARDCNVCPSERATRSIRLSLQALQARGTFRKVRGRCWCSRRTSPP